MNKFLFPLFLAASVFAGTDIRVETTRDFETWQTIRQDRLPIESGYVRLSLAGHELWVEHSADGVSWITDIKIPVARDANPQEFFRLIVL